MMAFSARVKSSRELNSRQDLFRIFQGVELSRAEISRVRFGGISSPELKELRYWWVSISISGIIGLFFFLPFFS